MRKFNISKSSVISFLLLNSGLFISAVGISIFKTPNHFAFGGTSGMSIILSDLFPKLNVGGFMWIINILLIIIGMIFLDIKKMGWTIYSSIALSFYVSLCEVVYPLSQPLTNDITLEFCFAVILPAVGSAIVFNVGASSGGTDIIAMILQKKTSLEIGKALMFSDLTIVLLATYIFGPKTGLYCILGLIAKCTVVDSVVESLNVRKVCTVISDNPQNIKRFIIEELHRSATENQVIGAYSGNPKVSLMTVLTRSEATKLRNFIRHEDPQAFITIVNSSEIIGKGFRNIQS